MGGRGSGRTSSYGFFAEKCEDYRSIDLAWLRKQNCLRLGYSGRITWSRKGIVTAAIGYRIEAPGLRLHYRHQSHGDTEWRDVNELIPFTRTGTAFMSLLPRGLPYPLWWRSISLPQMLSLEIREPIRARLRARSKPSS
jgi:hypothetical protein